MLSKESLDGNKVSRVESGWNALLSELMSSLEE